MDKKEKIYSIPFRLTDKQHKTLKIYCATRGINVQELLREMIFPLLDLSKKE